MPLLWCISMEMQGTLDTGKIIFSTFLKNIYWKGVMKCIAHMSYRFLVFMEKNYNFCLKVFRHPLQRYAAAQTVNKNLMAT